MKLLDRLPARIAFSAAALLAVLAGTAAGAGPAGAVALGPSQPGQNAKIPWHAFKLLNGWTSASAPQLKTGTPSWSLHNGVVYLRGAVKVTTETNAVIATLPKFARPAHNLYIQVYTNGDVPGTLEFTVNGDIQAYNGNSTAFTSLSGVSFTIAPIKSHKLALTNGWISSQSQWGTGDPAYAVSGGIVYLSGSLKAGAKGKAAFTLPKAARPPHKMLLSVYTNDSSTGTVTIGSGGQVFISGSDAVDFTSLANISYPVIGTKWTNFKLQDGWKTGFTAFHTATPAYAIINGVVYYTGTMIDPTGTLGLWTTLPKGVRTAADVLELEVYTLNGTTGGVGVTDSLGLAASNPFSNAKGCTSLAGIAYPQSS
ncbi:MAG TPA: hypothetical protein VFI65_04450 [Streptosporangiaceae bacterium]|nr:hypothetical protein [Streptosporangiaceae bacterium]